MNCNNNYRYVDVLEGNPHTIIWSYCQACGLRTPAYEIKIEGAWGPNLFKKAIDEGTLIKDESLISNFWRNAYV